MLLRRGRGEGKTMQMPASDGSPPLPPPYHAWYSPKQEHIRREHAEAWSPRRHGRASTAQCVDNTAPRLHRVPACIYWTNADGEKIEVTMVSARAEHECNTDVLDDIVYRGIVYRYAGVCRA